MSFNIGQAAKLVENVETRDGIEILALKGTEVEIAQVERSGTYIVTCMAGRSVRHFRVSKYHLQAIQA